MLTMRICRGAVERETRATAILKVFKLDTESCLKLL